MCKKFIFDINAFVGCIVGNETKFFNTLVHVMALPFIAVFQHQFLVTQIWKLIC